MQSPRNTIKGHRDAGAFSLNETDYNYGVFTAALKLRVEAADKQTSDLFVTAPCNASYLSRRVQNQIMSLMSDAIHKQILSDVSQCIYFSILADETTNVGQTEQLSLPVRFIKDTKVHEAFLCFVPVSSTTGIVNLTFRINVIYLFVSRHKVHSMNTHTLQNAG